MGGVDLSMTMGPPHPGEMLPEHTSTSSRPSLGFPLGTGLLLLVVFTLNAVFSCCYHWEKLRPLFQSSSASAAADVDAALPVSNSSARPTTTGNVGGDCSDKLASKDNKDENGRGQSLPVIMPGDQIPKFMALPCPCHKSSQELAGEYQHAPMKIQKFMVEIVVSSPPPSPPPPTNTSPFSANFQA